MPLIGFSTGALAMGDFARGLALLADKHTRAVELSALREQELPRLVASAEGLDLKGYDYVSVHAPSRVKSLSESEVARLLRPCIALGWPVVLHPDAIRDHRCWRDFGPLLCVENMDKRKCTGQTAAQLAHHFAELPEARLCFDFGHARQVDPTLGIARRILEDHGGRMTQIHLSEVDAACRHRPLSMASVWSFQEIAHLLPECPVIIESVVPPEGIDEELEMARKCFAGGPVRLAR